MTEACRLVFKKAYEAVLPNLLVRKTLRIERNPDTLLVSGRKYPLENNVYLAAFGKASRGMAAEAEEILGAHLVKGVASIPIGVESRFKMSGQKVELIEGAANNLPDQAAAEAAMKVEALARSLTSSDLLLVLVSGGGSALLPAPVPAISLEEKLATIKTLGHHGASIEQLNTVRQHLSRLKGGGLAHIAYPAKVVSLIFSDMIGNDLQFVASGPTVPRTTTALDALNAIVSLGAADSTPVMVVQYLKTKSKEATESKGTFDHVQNVLIGDSNIALNCAKDFAVGEFGFSAFVAKTDVTGEARKIGKQFAGVLNWVTNSDLKEDNYPDDLSGLFHLSNRGGLNFNSSSRFCIIWGGETTVKVHGTGLGGRNQESVLAFLVELKRLQFCKTSRNVNFQFLSAGTDGQDGPTDAAGAAVSSADYEMFDSNWLDKAEASLANNDSYRFFAAFLGGSCHVITGVTGTNVMDVQILMVEYK